MPLPIPRTPQWAERKACTHKWIVIYLPMPLGDAARALKAACCPACAASGSSIYLLMEAPK